MLATQPAWRYRKLMFNTFVLVGPAPDPAGIRTATTAADAMRRIAASGARFVSRGDESGTHERERALWQRAGRTPDTSRVLVSGAGMATTLRQAAEASAYTLSDKPTFLRMSNGIQLTLLFEGDPELMNTYAVVVGAPATPGHRIAVDWMAWLLGGRGRDVIVSYTVGGRRAFETWPPGVPSNDPYARPVGR
jgi:tungstate transport system substrate-binding protein